MKRAYPYVTRHQFAHGHGYTLFLTRSVHMELTPEEYDNLKASIDEVTESEKPLTREEVDDILASIDRPPRDSGQ
jgi:hypothetical protein